MKNASFRDAEFLDRSALDAELTRVFEHCHDCRRCLPLCPSFPALFDAIDGHELHADRLSSDERREVVDLCYQCQLCYNHCPYHPPHEWEIDFPRLMTRAKLVQAEEDGLPLAERIGMRQDAMGKVSCLTSAMTNAAFRNRAVRSLMEKVTGIDRRWPMPSYATHPFSKQLAGHRSPTARNGRAVLFTTCFVEYAEHETADAAVQVLEHNGVAVEGGYDRCCGAPFLHGGDLENARRNAEKVVAGLIDSVRQGLPVVVPGPTCSLLLKRDYPELLDSDDARLVAANTFDICEFLYRLGRDKKLVREFPVALGKVAYHLPCHLKSQNIGFRSQQLLAFAGAEVEMLDHCSGVDGTWGMKARYYEQSLKIADPLVRAVRELEPDHVASDCPLAAQRIQQETGWRVVHPVALLRTAYGLPERVKPVDPSEILDLTAYERVRADSLRRMIEHKRPRRIGVGDRLTFIFEDRDTVIFQIQELTRAERTVDPAEIAIECRIFNELVPGRNELSATLMIEITETRQIRAELDRLVGIDEHVFMDVGGSAVQATFDPKQREEDRISAVQYVKFPLGAELAARFADASVPVVLRVEHPSYRATARIEGASRASLSADLKAG